MKSELIKGDSLQELKKYDDNSIDLLCTDPPYGYSFMGRDWDKTLPPKEIFEECFRVLKPGSMAFVMSAPRSDVQYRMAEMLEKVGFRIDYTPIYWTYASGFPKAMNIGKMIDKREGNKRKVIGKKKNKLDFSAGKKEDKSFYESVWTGGSSKDLDITKGNSELEGSYGGFQPKPAVEVVIVAMKPLDKKGYLEQAQDNGKGITWFDDCRIPFSDESEQWGNVPADDIRGGNLINDETKNHPTLIKNSSPMGRFPANLLVSDDVLDDGKKRKAVPKGGFGAMDIGIGKPGETQEYRSKDYENYVKKQKSFKNAKTIGKTIKGNEHFLGGDIKQLNPAENYQKPKKKKITMPDLRDVGKKSKEAIGIDKLSFGQVENAERKEYEVWDIQEDDIGYSRYFSLDAWFSKNIKLLPEPVQKTFPFMIVPKASKSEKNDGLDNFEEQFKAGADFRPNHKEKALKGEDGNPYGRWNKIKNIHPTVKPLTLMSYLVTLGSRKGDMVLDPFMGSGTTPLACVSLERKYIGIDNEQDYYEIAKARVDKLEAPLKMWEKFS
jgi:DNA modification methylase